jgi:hypothetical protein
MTTSETIQAVLGMVTVTIALTALCRARKAETKASEIDFVRDEFKKKSVRIEERMLALETKRFGLEQDIAEATLPANVCVSILAGETEHSLRFTNEGKGVASDIYIHAEPPESPASGKARRNVMGGKQQFETVDYEIPRLVPGEPPRLKRIQGKNPPLYRCTITWRNPDGKKHEDKNIDVKVRTES